MAAKSDYLKVNLLNEVLRATEFTAPGAVYLAAFTVAPTDAGGGTEVSGGAYTRQTLAFAAPSGNQVANSADILFPIATVAWGTVVHFGIFDAVSGGNMLYHTPFTASRTIDVGDQLRVPTGQLIVGES
jgi:hypothetical protein